MGSFYFLFFLIFIFLLLNEFYYIYSYTMIITTQLYSISIPNPQPIPPTPNLSPLETISFPKSVSQYPFCKEVHCVLFLGYTCDRIWCWYPIVWPTSLSMIVSRSIGWNLEFFFLNSKIVSDHQMLQDVRHTIMHSVPEIPSSEPSLMDSCHSLNAYSVMRKMYF